MNSYRIELPVFEGPMDLLFYLIKKNEVDIYDIPISEVTEQYLAYLDLLKGMNVLIASEFLVMAATLMFIKSRMLLPILEEEDQDEVVEDPRAPLVQQLLEYQQFKEIALSLEARATAEENIFSRWIPLELLDQESYEEHEEYDLFLLFKYFSKLISESGEDPFEVARIQVNVEDMREELLQMLKHCSRFYFHEFVIKRTFQELIAIFLALLELIKRRRVRVIQPTTFGPIEVMNRT